MRPVCGWNQCVKCVTPREIAHSLIDLRYARRDVASRASFRDGSRRASFAYDFARQLVAHLSDAEGVDAEVLGSRTGYSVLAEAARDSGLAVGDLAQKSFTRGDSGGCHGLSALVRM